MRLSRAGEYAVRCVLYLANRPAKEVVPRWAVAQAMEIPEPFLAKIGQQLARAGILEILQGAKGGYRLRRSPQEISLLEVVEAVMGELFLNDCLLRPESCSRSSHCMVHRVWEKARDQLRQTLSQASFASLLQGETCFDIPHGETQEASQKGPHQGHKDI